VRRRARRVEQHQQRVRRAIGRRRHRAIGARRRERVANGLFGRGSGELAGPSEINDPSSDSVGFLRPSVPPTAMAANWAFDKILVREYRPSLG
jgi:hypothetical protein